MIAKTARFIGVLMALLVLSTSSGLHYTHDITHHHDCHSDHHEDTPVDECALCWFVLHQVTHHFAADALLPDIAIQECISLLHGRYRFPSQDGVERLQRNKDPPSYI